MEALPAEELAGEKMKCALDLKGEKVKETDLVAQADKVRRELGAEAAGANRSLPPRRRKRR